MGSYFSSKNTSKNTSKQHLWHLPLKSIRKYFQNEPAMMFSIWHFQKTKKKQTLDSPPSNLMQMGNAFAVDRKTGKEPNCLLFDSLRIFSIGYINILKGSKRSSSGFAGFVSNLRT